MDLINLKVADRMAEKRDVGQVVGKFTLGLVH